MTKLNLIDGGGEIDSGPVDICGVCGVPHYARCRILDRHLQYMRLLGQRGPMAPWMVSKLIARHLHGCGIAATAHQLRHRMLSQSYNTSGDVIGVQELAGHASIGSTTGYVKLSGKRTREIVAGLPVPELRRIT